MLARRTYRFRLEPTASQLAVFYRFAGARRFVYNWALARRQAFYREHGHGISQAQLSAELTALKHTPGYEWLAEIDSQALQQALADLDRAFKNFFEKRARYPKFKSRKKREYAFRIPQRIQLVGDAVYVPKVGWVKVRLHRAVVGETKSATFKQDVSGHWYVTLVAEFERPDAPTEMPDPAQTIGIDLGLKDFAVTSDGEHVAAPKFYRTAERRLRRAQRTLARRQKGSGRRARARRRVAALHARIAAQRRDFQHKLSQKLVRGHEGICVETLSVKGLARTKLAKSVHDAGWGEFLRMLEYKRQWQGKPFQRVGREFPSTQLCHDCGARNRSLTLADREWTCPACGVIQDRDLNAALNIRDQGLHLLNQRLAGGCPESLNACREQVRLHNGSAA